MIDFDFLKGKDSSIGNGENDIELGQLGNGIYNYYQYIYIYIYIYTTKLCFCGHESVIIVFIPGFAKLRRKYSLVYFSITSFNKPPVYILFCDTHSPPHLQNNYKPCGRYTCASLKTYVGKTKSCLEC